MNFKEKIDKKVVAGAVVGSASGGVIGSSIGIVGLGTAVAGTLPLAIVGGAIGILGVLAYRGIKKK